MSKTIRVVVTGSREFKDSYSERLSEHFRSAVKSHCKLVGATGIEVAQGMCRGCDTLITDWLKQSQWYEGGGVIESFDPGSFGHLSDPRTYYRRNLAMVEWAEKTPDPLCIGFLLSHVRNRGTKLTLKIAKEHDLAIAVGVFGVGQL